MATSRRTDKPASPRLPPATTPEAREDQMINLAIDAAERQMMANEASSQIIVHYLKLGSSRERLEQERLRIDAKLAEKRIDAIESAQRIEDLMGEAISAFKSYAGQDEVPDESYDD